MAGAGAGGRRTAFLFSATADEGMAGAEREKGWEAWLMKLSYVVQLVAGGNDASAKRFETYTPKTSRDADSRSTLIKHPASVKEAAVRLCLPFLLL